MKTNKTQNKHGALFLHRMPVLFTAVLLLLSATCLHGQVTIGDGTPPQNYSILEIVSNSKGGLRLPQLTTAERDALQDGESGPAFTSNPTRTAPFLYEGLTIYNTTTRCVEYYNAQRWISMCEGTSRMTIDPDPCINIAADGSGCNNEFTITDPDCVNGPFSVTVITGSDYARLADVDEAAGTFKVSFLPNNSINPRSAIIRVTSSCTALYKDFLFTQLGQSCDNSLGIAPKITSVPAGNNISFCAGGAVYLSVAAGTPGLDQLIWTRNGIEIARGVNHIVVSQAGVYDVWMGIIGCNQLGGNAITVTRSGIGAPSPVSIVVVGNNGLVCDQNGTTRLIALKASTGTVRWFRNGVLQAESSPDNEIEAGIGDWFAVVNDGSCWSTPSATVTVSVDPNAGTELTKPTVSYIGGFCAGGSVLLKVTNPQPGYIYTWYENNTPLAPTGQEYLYHVPATSQVVIRCRATLSGSCAAEAISSETITTGTIPSRPVITGDKQLCSGIATLNAIPTSTGTFTYAWYKGNQLYATTQSITVTQGGEYSVTVTDGCTSPEAKITISDVSSAIPTVTLTRSVEKPNQGDIVIYAASINFGPATGYIWSITNATLQSGGGNTDSYAVVKFDKTGAASVKVAVSNACGTNEAIHAVTNVMSACADPVSVSPSTNTSLTANAGYGVTLGKVSAIFSSGTPAPKFQWYINTSASNTGGNLISGANGDSYIATNTEGTYHYYCVVSNLDCPSGILATGVYTVKVNPDPSKLPAGVGSLSGKTCFDIASGNDNTNSCAPLSARTPQKTDFANTTEQDPAAGATAPYTGTQVYTFIPSGTVSNVRFMYADPSGKVIESLTPKADYSGNNINSACKVVVVYKASLNEDLKGLTRNNALKADLYAVYNDNATNTGTDRTVKLTASFQDCACCGAFTATGVWKAFMCHNLGADESLDPFTPAAGIHGAKYRFGAKAASYTMAEDQANSGLITGWNSLPYQNDSKDWDMINNNPCPAGWRVPTKAEWDGVINTNQSVTEGTSWANSPTNYTSGRKFGQALFLPAAGVRNYDNGQLLHRGSNGHYWSSTQYTTSSGAYRMYFTKDEQSQGGLGTNAPLRTNGFSVRCIAE